MIEYVEYDPLTKKYIAVVSGDDSHTPLVYIGIGITEDEALNIAKEKYNNNLSASNRC